MASEKSGTTPVQGMSTSVPPESGTGGDRDPGTGSPGGGRKVGRGRQGGTGAFADNIAGGENDGVSSAKPQTITGQEDASFKQKPENDRPDAEA